MIMTEEQIKQNTEVYAKERCIRYNEQYGACYDAYIAGAHSRDEEIYDLKRDIEDLQKMVKMRSDAFECARKEIGRLSNPWISVKERLPEKIENKGVSKNVFVTWSDGTRGEAYYNYKEYKAPRWEIKGAGIMKPAYWMPIPELKKGE